MADQMEYFRDQMFRNSQQHSGMSQDQMLTPESIKQAETNEMNTDRLKQILKEAIDGKHVEENDLLLKSLVHYFMNTAKTTRGREDALRMAIFTTMRINKEFVVEKRK